MANFNKVILLGNIVRTPELRYAPGSNAAVAKTALAVNRKYKDKDETMFIDIVIFGKLAETLEQYATQGTQILVEGRLAQNKWQDTDGKNRSKHEIIVDSFQLVGGRKDRDSSDSAYNTGSSFKADSDIDDNDIPF